MELTHEELLRYNRQITIPDIGEEGQRKLKQARVFVAGVGGLGSISSCYLTAAGIGYLKIVDKDKVDYSNLNRQILHWTGDIDEWKSVSGSRKLRNLNPHCVIDAVQAEITEANCAEIVGDCSIIVDALDNMKTRRFLNAVSVAKGIPYLRRRASTRRINHHISSGDDSMPGMCLPRGPRRIKPHTSRHSRTGPGSDRVHPIDRGGENNSGSGRAFSRQAFMLLRVRHDIQGIQDSQKS
jgi:molybdopterin/thiamine biosynthesis adenylyltransferase